MSSICNRNSIFRRYIKINFKGEQQMKKISRSKILTTILVLSLILSAALPTGIVSKAATENVVKEPDYSTSLVGSGTNFTALEADGWVASYSQDPQNGDPFTDLASICFSHLHGVRPHL